MGFGSYDESEQKDQSMDTDDEDAVDVHENTHDGEVSLETDGMSTGDLLEQMPDADEDEE